MAFKMSEIGIGFLPSLGRYHHKNVLSRL